MDDRPTGWKAAGFERFANVAFEYRLGRLRTRAAAVAISHVSYFSANEPSTCRTLLDGFSEAVAKALLKVTALLWYQTFSGARIRTSDEIESMLQRSPELLD